MGYKFRRAIRSIIGIEQIIGDYLGCNSARTPIIDILALEDVFNILYPYSDHFHFRTQRVENVASSEQIQISSIGEEFHLG